MSICGIFCGVVYNEYFGLPVDFFNTRYHRTEIINNNETRYIWEKNSKAVYPFGVDPVWVFKDNELIFLNSLKMKISVVMGVIQMVFGMFLQFIKHYHRRDWLNMFTSWLPQVIYLCSFFGYMVFLIIRKWCTKFPDDSNGVNLIQVLISMLLSPGSVADDLKLYGSQHTVQVVIALLFVLSIPFMLIVKPIFEICLHKAGDNSVVEVFVINLIEVIEFCLGALSHTASYLRLWALSLAHSQLSHVLYEQLFLMGLNSKSPVLMFVCFAAWAGFSVGILLGMEAFSSLLHAIRLMWVEFSSKFYTGTGYEFIPLSFKSLAASIGVN